MAAAAATIVAAWQITLFFANLYFALMLSKLWRAYDVSIICWVLLWQFCGISPSPHKYSSTCRVSLWPVDSTLQGSCSSYPVFEEVCTHGHLDCIKGHKYAYLVGSACLPWLFTVMSNPTWGRTLRACMTCTLSMHILPVLMACDLFSGLGYITTRGRLHWEDPYRHMWMFHHRQAVRASSISSPTQHTS